MKKETIKEIGKLFIDLAKIIFGIAILVPLVKDNDPQFIAVMSALVLIMVGVYFTNKGI